MRRVNCRVLSGIIRQVALASEHVASPIPGVGAATTAGPSHHSGFTAWLDPRLIGPYGQACSPSPSGGLAGVFTRGMCARAHPPPDADPRNDGTGGSDFQVLASSSAPTAAAASPRQQVARGKSARHHARTASGSPAQPVSRGAKDKAAKVPGAKAAAAMAAAKAGGQQPLPREVRLQLDAQLAEMPLPQPPCRSRAADGPRTVHVTGFYIGHPFTRASAEAVAARLRRQPLLPGVAVAGVYHDHEDALIILHNLSAALAPAAPETLEAEPAAAPAAPAAVTVAGVPASITDEGAAASATAGEAVTAAAPEACAPGAQGAEAVEAEAQAPQEVAGEAAAALGQGQAREDLLAELDADAGAVGGSSALGPLGNCGGGDNSSSGQEAGCMALALLEYGGVVLFNVPESLHSEVLARVVAAALPADAKLGEVPMPVARQSSLRPGGRADSEGWQQAVVEKLSMHKEEQLIVVDPSMMSGRGMGRWIRKLDDSLHIWSWDSTNLESIARVLSQSAAIRYYNQECEDMLERYETIMPMGYEPPDRLSTLDRLLFWRSRLPLRDLRQMVFKSSGIRVRLDSRLGLRDAPSGTWESARHHAVWEAMRREFEMDDRRDTLMEKTDLLKQSCLDLISANNESFTKRSELSIILLISVEIVISLTDLHSALSAENVGRAATWALRGLGLGA